MKAACRERLGKLWAVIPTAAFNFGVFRDELADAA
jgi:hypothetical protein